MGDGAWLLMRVLVIFGAGGYAFWLLWSGFPVAGFLILIVLQLEWIIALLERLEHSLLQRRAQDAKVNGKDGGQGGAGSA